jgi:hypothetical protein
MTFINRLFMYGRFSIGLGKFLKDSISAEKSRRIILQRLKNRTSNFLSLVRKTIYENPQSPFLALLKEARCQYGDLEKMALKDGVEQTLSELKENGIYLTCDEFKGRQDIVRSGKTFHFNQQDFDNPFLSRHFEGRTSASRSAGTRTFYDFDFLAASWTVYLSLMMEGCNISDLPMGMWFPVMPGAGPVALLSYLKGGKTPKKWFSPVHKNGFKPSLKSRMGNGFIIFRTSLSRSGLPRPEYVSVNDPAPIAYWMSDMVKQFGGCWLTTYTTLATRVCQQARLHGLDLSGAKFIANGEPLTEAKRNEIESVNAGVYPIYGTMETGAIAIGCFRPDDTDDAHILRDGIALIQHRREVPLACTSVDAFLVTTLLREAAKILLNVEVGDYGKIRTLSCGCRLDQLGLVDHISNVRSFEKLTGEGMSFIGTDLLHIIEKELPTRFGGTSTDYQMVEEEDRNGYTRLYIYINPEVGTLVDQEVIETVFSLLSRGRDGKRMMTSIWEQAQTLQVKRARPILSARGKLLPLHIHKYSITKY